MITIPYYANGFSSVGLTQHNGHHVLQTYWSELLRVAVKVGKPSLGYVNQFGTLSAHERQYRRYLIRANLKVSPETRLVRSEVYDWLDPSEKGAVSYFLGLAMTNLFSEVVLGIPWLSHLDVFRSLLPPIVAASSKRPDLVGSDVNNEWYVFECKGRTNTPKRDLAATAKKQAKAIRYIDNARPKACIASIAYFKSRKMELYIEDPEPDKKKGFDLEIDLPTLIRSHYSPYVTFIDRSESQRSTRIVEGQDFTVSSIPGTDDFFGLADTIYKVQDQVSAAQEFSRKTQPVANEKYSIGLDGTYLELGKEWDTEEMLLEPDKRSF